MGGDLRDNHVELFTLKIGRARRQLEGRNDLLSVSKCYGRLNFSAISLLRAQPPKIWWTSEGNIYQSDIGGSAMETVLDRQECKPHRRHVSVTQVKTISYKSPSELQMTMPFGNSDWSRSREMYMPCQMEVS